MLHGVTTKSLCFLVLVACATYSGMGATGFFCQDFDLSEGGSPAKARTGQQRDATVSLW